MSRVFVICGLIFSMAAFRGALADMPEQSLSSETPVLQIVFVGDQGRFPTLRTVTLSELRSLPVSGFRTTTIWTEGLTDFRGVWLSDLLAHLDIKTGHLNFVALNDYTIEIPLEQIFPGGPLIAYELNGNPMSPRNMGPLWVIFPYDSNPKFQTETVYAQSIWQLNRIEVSR